MSASKIAQPLVSIGLPVRNSERQIAQTIDSVLAQTLGDFELIVSDNASTDATVAVAERYMQRDPRIRLLRQSVNRGVSANWNAVAPALIQRVHREAVGGFPDQKTRSLLEEIKSYAGVSEVLRPDFTAPITPLLAIQFRKGTLAADFFSAVTTLGTPLDVTLQEIRIECFFPANEQTAAKAAAGYN